MEDGEGLGLQYGSKLLYLRWEEGLGCHLWFFYVDEWDIAVDKIVAKEVTGSASVCCYVGCFVLFMCKCCGGGCIFTS